MVSSDALIEEADRRAALYASSVGARPPYPETATRRRRNGKIALNEWLLSAPRIVTGATAIGRFRTVRFAARKLPVGFQEQWSRS